MTARRKPKRSEKLFHLETYALDLASDRFSFDRWQLVKAVMRAYRLGKRHGRAERAAKGKR